jgi:hypothetical protein
LSCRLASFFRSGLYRSDDLPNTFGSFDEVDEVQLMQVVLYDLQVVNLFHLLSNRVAVDLLVFMAWLVVHALRLVSLLLARLQSISTLGVGRLIPGLDAASFTH